LRQVGVWLGNTSETFALQGVITEQQTVCVCVCCPP